MDRVYCRGHGVYIVFLFNDILHHFLYPNLKSFVATKQGAGKSHTMEQVASKGFFPLQSYVVIDPDEIRSYFPEYHLLAYHCPKRAGELTHREAGYVTEIVTAVAL